MKDADGKEVSLVTIDDFSRWIIAEVTAEGKHREEVDTRFVREQIRCVANAAIQQSAQHILRKFGPGWLGVAKEILSLRTASTSGKEFDGIDLDLSAVEEENGRDGEEGEDENGEGGEEKNFDYMDDEPNDEGPRLRGA